jgi:hypothetical protein
MKTPKAPAPPDPYAQADAQTQSNKDTATYNNAITHGNTYTPLGDSTYTGRIDPVTGATVYDQTISLDPSQQQLLDVQNQQDLSLGLTGNKMLGQIDSAIGRPIDTSGLPDRAGSLNVNGPGIQGQIDTSGLPALYGADDLAGARQQVSDALYRQQAAYLDPQYADREQALRTEIANKGIAEGSEAWRNLRDQFDRGRSFDYSRARDSAITGSGSELERLANIALANRGQMFGERATSAGFQNDAESQSLSEALARAQFQNQSRAQGLDELYAERARPLNEFSALRGSTQVDVPQFSSAQNSVTNPADIAGYIGQNYANQLGVYNAKMNSRNALLGGLFGLGSAAIGAYGG